VLSTAGGLVRCPVVVATPGNVSLRPADRRNGLGACEIKTKQPKKGGGQPFGLA